MATILIVEDDLTTALLIRTMLTKVGHGVISALNGQQGLRMIRQHKPDLILCDLVMPVMDGGALCSALNADPEHRSIPIVVMTAMQDQFARGHYECTGYLPKPFTANDLYAMVASLIDDAPRPPGD